jgi:serine/threonine-protein kinase
MTLAPGQIIDGKYRIIRSLGEGGMGAVLLGENTRIGRQVAIKVLHASLAEQGTQVERFELEAQLAAKIGSEHIVEVFDMGDLPNGESYMVMEYLQGESLGDRLSRERRLTPELLTGVAAQALSGLARAHEARIIHRDMKPDNIFLARRGNTETVKLLDFGVSKLLADNQRRDGSNLTLGGTLVGTPAYMSPEQARGHAIDHRTDLYALGVVLYECACGHTPFGSDNIQQILFQVALEEPPALLSIVPDLDPQFAAIVARAMARQPEDRFQSADEFREAVMAWREERGLDPEGLGLILRTPARTPAFSHLALETSPTQPGTRLANTPMSVSSTPPPGGAGLGTMGTIVGNIERPSTVPPPRRRNAGIFVLGTLGAMAVIGFSLHRAPGFGASAAQSQLAAPVAAETQTSEPTSQATAEATRSAEAAHSSSDAASATARGQASAPSRGRPAAQPSQPAQAVQAVQGIAARTESISRTATPSSPSAATSAAAPSVASSAPAAPASAAPVASASPAPAAASAKAPAADTSAPASAPEASQTAKARRFRTDL